MVLTCKEGLAYDCEIIDCKVNCTDNKTVTGGIRARTCDAPCNTQAWVQLSHEFPGGCPSGCVDDPRLPVSSICPVGLLFVKRISVVATEFGIMQ